MKVTYENDIVKEIKKDINVSTSRKSTEPRPPRPETDDYFQDDFKPLIDDKWQTIKHFKNSIHMLALVDPIIREQQIVLHKWQVEESEKICSAPADSMNPFKYALCAANGSGKDAYVIAPFSVFFITAFVRSLCIITSSSGTQLTNQTENYIRSIGEKINNWTIGMIGQPILRIKKRHIQCLISGGEIFLFATDEEGKAEGYHPKDPNAKMAIIVNEAKSVPPEIFRALRRCTGYSHWINVSTPGEPIGDFYKSFERWENKRRITYYDCPHQSPAEFEEDKIELGEHSPYFRSKWLAEFSFIGGKYVVNQAAVERLFTKIKLGSVGLIESPVKRLGLDIALSTNGDETVITSFKGNKQDLLLTYRIQDATLLTDAIDRDLRDKFNLRVSAPEKYEINADDGGVGRAVIDMLRARGWNINRVLNQSAATNKKHYRNKGAEMWYKLSRLIEDAAVILLPDEKLHSQIKSRKYKDSAVGLDKLALESKKDMIAEGLPSPDRADATVLALKNVPLNEWLNKITIIDDADKPRRGMTAEELEMKMLDGEFDKEKIKGSGKKLNGSLNALMNRGKNVFDRFTRK